MPIALFSFKLDSDGRVRMAHIFFGATQLLAELHLKEHADICPKFGPAFRADETTEFAREIAELPPADGDDLEEWLDELLELAEDEDDVIDVDPERD